LRPRQRAAGALARDHRHEPAVGPGEQDADAEHHEGQGGVQRHVDVGGDAAERRDAVDIPDRRQGGDHGRDERAKLGNPLVNDGLEMEAGQGQAEDEEGERGVGRHAVGQPRAPRHELVVEEHLVQAGIPARQDPHQLGEADQGHEEPERQPGVPRAAHGGPRADQPERQAGGDEAEGGGGIHRHQPRQDARQDVETRRPAHQDEQAHPGGTHAGTARERRERRETPGDRPPHEPPSLSMHIRRLTMSSASGQAPTRKQSRSIHR